MLVRRFIRPATDWPLFPTDLMYIAVNEVRTPHGYQMEFLEHDNDEPKIDRKFPAPWKLLAALIAFSAFAYFYSNTPDWWALALGGFAGITLALWAVEVTGNKVPNSWRSNSSR